MVANRVLLSCMLAGMLLLAGCLHAVDPPPGDEPGVEPKDTDGDGVLDADDLCADTPAGATVDPSGCTEEPEPPIPAQVGVGIHHITEFWSEQEQLNQTGALFIRINIVGTHFGNFVNDRSGYDWTELDSIVLPNADLVILATVYPTHSGLDSTANPKYPQTDSDKADFEAWLNALAGR